MDQKSFEEERAALMERVARAEAEEADARAELEAMKGKSRSILMSAIIGYLRLSPSVIGENTAKDLIRLAVENDISAAELIQEFMSGLGISRLLSPTPPPVPAVRHVEGGQTRK